jgi:hypothetical protein
MPGHNIKQRLGQHLAPIQQIVDLTDAFFSSGAPGQESDIENKRICQNGPNFKRSISKKQESHFQKKEKLIHFIISGFHEFFFVFLIWGIFSNLFFVFCLLKTLHSSPGFGSPPCPYPGSLGSARRRRGLATPRRAQQGEVV